MPSGRGQLLAIVAVTIVVVLVGLAVAHAVTPARQARARAVAQEAADRVLPGVVRVLSARGLGAAGGYAIRGALSDDADAVVSFGLPGGARCPAGSSCEAAIAPAVQRARADAAELRVLLAAFEQCGLPVSGVRDLQRIDAAGGVADGEARAARLSITVVVPDRTGIGTDAGAALLADLDRCALQHARGRAALPRTDPAGGVEMRVDVTGADAVGRERRAGEPTALALMLAADALAPDVRHRTSVRATAAGIVQQATREFGPVLAPEARAALAAAVERAATEHLSATGTAAANPPSLHARLVHLPGSTSRVRAYATFRAAGSPPGGDDRAVAVDVDLDGGDPVVLRVLTLGRPWPQPFEAGPR